MWFHKQKELPPHFATGVFGEKEAVKYLKKQGYRILAKSWQSDRYEIDIICEAKAYIVFVEVKTRRQSAYMTDKYGDPSKSVTQDKQRHMREAARRYLSLHPSKKAPRMDVIEVFLDPTQEKLTLQSIHHMEDAF